MEHLRFLNELEKLFAEKFPSDGRKLVFHVDSNFIYPKEIPPCAYVPILRMQGDDLVFELAHWWLLPPYAVDKAIIKQRPNGEVTFKYPPKTVPLSHFNTKKDSIIHSQNRYWEQLLMEKRCLVPVTAFVEWPDREMSPDNKAGSEFKLAHESTFYLAGIWEEVDVPVFGRFLSFNVITTEPNELLRALPHHRMPVIIDRANFGRWFAEGTSLADLLKMLVPYDAKEMSSDIYFREL